MTHPSTPLASILMFALAALVGSVGQLFYKSGADLTGTGWQAYPFNIHRSYLGCQR